MTKVSLRPKSTAGRWVLALSVLLAAGTAVVASGGVGSGAGAAHTLPAAPNTDLNTVYAPGDLISEPFVLPTRHIDYLYSTGLGSSPHLPAESFVKMGHWLQSVDAMPNPPSWAEPNAAVWSPDVRKFDHHYIMWYSAITEAAPYYGAPGVHFRCLGWAKANNPLGPFVTRGSAPVICQADQYGDIDPRTVVVNGQEYLLWKSNNNVAPTPGPTRIYSQRLAANGTTLEGQPVELMENSQPWETMVTESPDLVQGPSNHFYLFFSSTDGASSPIAGLGVATCAGPSGPCTNTSQGPWLGANNHGVGPCEESLFEQNGALWLLYSPRSNYYPGAYPTLAVSRVAFGPHLPYVAIFGSASPGP